jgi:hypothetical protein
MWMQDGTKLTGYNGTWRNCELELRSPVSSRGEYTLIQDGGDQPGPEWKRDIFPNRFGRTPVRYRLRVPEADVSDVHEILTTGYVPLHDKTGHDIQARVRVIAQDDQDRLAVETEPQEPRHHWDALIREYGFEEYDRSWVFGWVPRNALTDIKVDRIERSS